MTRRQAERVEAMKREADGKAAVPRGELPGCDRETAVRFMVEQQGKSPGQAAADYDRAVSETRR